MINYTTVGGSATQGGGCYDTEFSDIDSAWQMSYSDHSFGFFGTQLFLKSKGIEPKLHHWQMAGQIESGGLEKELADFIGEHSDEIKALQIQTNGG